MKCSSVLNFTVISASCHTCEAIKCKFGHILNFGDSHTPSLIGPNLAYRKCMVWCARFHARFPLDTEQAEIWHEREHNGTCREGQQTANFTRFQILGEHLCPLLPVYQSGPHLACESEPVVCFPCLNFSSIHKYCCSCRRKAANKPQT